MMNKLGRSDIKKKQYVHIYCLSWAPSMLDPNPFFMNVTGPSHQDIFCQTCKECGCSDLWCEVWEVPRYQSKINWVPIEALEHKNSWIKYDIWVTKRGTFKSSSKSTSIHLTWWIGFCQCFWNFGYHVVGDQVRLNFIQIFGLGVGVFFLGGVVFKAKTFCFQYCLVSTNNKIGCEYFVYFWCFTVTMCLLENSRLMTLLRVSWTKLGIVCQFLQMCVANKICVICTGVVAINSSLYAHIRTCNMCTNPKKIHGMQLCQKFKIT